MKKSGVYYILKITGKKILKRNGKMKNVFITGGSRGIGRACVEAFCAHGCSVTFQYNKSVDEAKALCKKTGARSIRCDFEDSAAVFKTAEEVGECDILINCAGVSETGLLTDMTDVAYRRLMQVNLDSAFYLMRAFIPGMVRRHSGSIVNISSVWGICGASCEAAYSASKGALIALTKSVAKEYGPSGVICNCVCPGVIETDMNAHLSEADIAALKEQTPLMRTGMPQEVAEAVLFLSEAKFITGQVLSVDGGFAI